METQTRLSCHSKFILAENITILSFSSDDYLHASLSSHVEFGTLVIEHDSFQNYLFTDLFKNWINAAQVDSARCSTVFWFALAVILTCSIFISLTHMFKLRTFVQSLRQFFGQTLNGWTWELFDNQGSMIYIYIILFPNPSAWAGYDTRSILSRV